MRIGLLGAGFMGQTHLERYLKRKCDITVFDADIERAKQLALANGCRYSDSFDTMLAEVDAIDICLPTHLHKQYALRAMQAGKHVLCEKPMALTTEECDEMIRSSESTGCVLMIAHVLRFWPEYTYIRNLILSGELGNVLYVTGGRAQPMPAWSKDNWMIKPDTSNGGVVDFHIHDLDFCQWLFGEPVSTTSHGCKSAYGGWETVATLMHHANGAICSLTACNMMPDNYPFTAHMSVVCSEGTIEYASGASPTLRVFQNGTWHYPELPEDDGYQLEIDEFLRCIAAKANSKVVCPQDGKRALKLALHCKNLLDQSEV